MSGTFCKDSPAARVAAMALMEAGAKVGGTCKLSKVNIYCTTISIYIYMSIVNQTLTSWRLAHPQMFSTSCVSDMFIPLACTPLACIYNYP